MKRVYLLAISILATFALASCEKYDDYGEMMMLRSNSADIQAAVVELYPQARIIEMDKDRKTIEVDIIDSNNIVPLGNKAFYDRSTYSAATHYYCFHKNLQNMEKTLNTL